MAAVDDAEKRSTVTSSRPPPPDRTSEGRVSGTPSAAETEEPAKRRRESRSKQPRRLRRSRLALRDHRHCLILQ